MTSGDLLRAEQAANSPDGALIADFIKNGKIVPIEITIRLLEKAIVRYFITWYLGRHSGLPDPAHFLQKALIIQYVETRITNIVICAVKELLKSW